MGHDIKMQQKNCSGIIEAFLQFYNKSYIVYTACPLNDLTCAFHNYLKQGGDITRLQKYIKNQKCHVSI